MVNRQILPFFSFHNWPNQYKRKTWLLVLLLLNFEKQKKIFVAVQDNRSCKCNVQKGISRTKCFLYFYSARTHYRYSLWFDIETKKEKKNTRLPMLLLKMLLEK